MLFRLVHVAAAFVAPLAVSLGAAIEVTDVSPANDSNGSYAPASSFQNFTNATNLTAPQEGLPAVTTPTVADKNVTFDDLDLDSGEVGGIVSWIPPSDISLVTHYVVYFAMGDWSNRLLIGNTSVGKDSFLVPANTLIEQYVLILVYTLRGATEWPIPGSCPLNDTSASVSQLLFNHIDVRWIPPADIAPVAVYRLYLTHANTGFGRSLIGGDVPVGTNIVVVPPSTDFIGYSHLAVYTKSTLFEQSTPRALLIEESLPFVTNVTFSDEDLDLGDIGGDVSWAAPTDVTQVAHYNVYLAINGSSTGRSFFGQRAVGTNFLSVPANFAPGVFTHWLVYTTSFFVEHQTPVAALIIDTMGSVQNVNFVGEDLNLMDLGGIVYWQPPADTSRVVSYSVYVAKLLGAWDSSELEEFNITYNGSNTSTIHQTSFFQIKGYSFGFRSQIGADVAAGLNTITVPNMPSLSYDHFLVYSKSTLGEQTTPMVLSFSDARSRFLVSNVDFVDLDLDEDELGGNITWSLPEVLGKVAEYNVYLAENASASKRVAVGSVKSATTELALPADTARSVSVTFTHIVVHSSSSITQSVGFAVHMLHDEAASVSSIDFPDADLDRLQVGGIVSYAPPPSDGRVHLYRIYVSPAPSGTGRSLSLDSVPVGTNQGAIPADTFLAGYKHVLVYTESSLAEQTTPVATALFDRDLSVSNVSFLDSDLDAGDLGGFSYWQEPNDTSQVLHYSLYIAEDAIGTARTYSGNAPAGSGVFLVPSDTVFVTNAHLLVYIATSFVEQSTPVGIPVFDELASVSDITFVDKDLDFGDIGGIATWSPPVRCCTSW
jgi:hypothetical protein